MPDETVDAAFDAARARERALAESLSVGDRMASLLVKGIPKLDELQRLAVRWMKLRHTGGGA